MKKRYTEEQIVKILREGASGAIKVGELCRKYGISDPTYYSWKSKYEGMEVPDVKKLKSLEEENQRLKKLLAESALDNDALKALVEKYSKAR